MKRRGAVLLLAVVAAVGLHAVPAGAEGSRGWHARVLVVDKDSHHGSCYGKHHRRPYRTIQAAVDAARSGDTIKVCPGLYEETVKVQTKHLTIKGAKAGVDATEREGRRESVVVGDPEDDGDAEGVARGVVQLLADHITWDGFKIRDNTTGPGMYTSPAHSGYLIRDTIFLDNGLGLHLGASGEHPTVVCRNRFTANNEFTEDGAAVLFADQGVDDVLIQHNKSVDDLTFASSFNSTRVRVTANWIRARVGDTEFPGPASAIFIGAGEYQVLANRSRTNGVGIHLGLGTSGVVVDGNTALDNALDCQDQSTPLANTWQGNVGVSSHPPAAALCTAPTELTQARYGHDGEDHDKRKHKKHHRPDPCVCTLPWRF